MIERILVVDDEQSILELISSMLKAEGYECIIASGGVEALSILNSGTEFDLIISGLIMPEMNGFTLLERTRGTFPSIPFVMATAVRDPEVTEEAYRLGAYDYILKPFFREQLLTAVRRALEYRLLKLENRAFQVQFPIHGPNTQSESVKALILFVHDEEPVREMVQSMLTAVGYRCEIAASRRAAWDLLNSGEPFELVISGVMLPEGQGLFLLEQAREGFPEIPFVMLTCVRDESVIEKVYRTGAYDYIEQYPRAEVVAAARRALEYRRLRLENRAFRVKLGSSVS